MPAREWTPDEERLLRQNYEKMANTELAEELDVSAKTVAKKLTALGLERKKKPAATGSEKPQARAGSTRNHQNVQCRHCLMVDGYEDQEGKCRYCGHELFKGDVL